MKISIKCTQKEFDDMASNFGTSCIGAIMNMECPSGITCEECFKKNADITIVDGGEEDGGSGSPE